VAHPDRVQSTYLSRRDIRGRAVAHHPSTVCERPAASAGGFPKQTRIRLPYVEFFGDAARVNLRCDPGTFELRSLGVPGSVGDDAHAPPAVTQLTEPSENFGPALHRICGTDAVGPPQPSTVSVRPYRSLNSGK